NASILNGALELLPESLSTMSDAEIDQAILNASILNGALELLPESLSTMAIIPLQMKLVYRVGKSYGFELDRGHIKDFLATLGVGLTSQYLEQAGRKLLGGLLGKIGGGFLRGLGKQAVSSGMSFASTYALGHVARRYYAGGRSFSSEMLRSSFDSMLGEAKSLHRRYLPEIQARARTLDSAKIIDMVRQG
ncbi:MAG TPA: GTPase, partial [Accumulibacter sp.]|nr:GTPase [Accumulibacter sp.]